MELWLLTSCYSMYEPRHRDASLVFKYSFDDPLTVQICSTLCFQRVGGNIVLPLPVLPEMDPTLTVTERSG